MNIELEVIDNVIQPKYTELKDGKYIAKLTNMDLRTLSQNNALWLWLSQIAKRFNDDSVTTDMVIRPQVKWNKEKIKAMCFDPIMSLVTSKSSSTKLSKEEFSDTVETLVEAMGRKGQELPPFPDKSFLKEK